ncbi:MAG: septation protein A [Rhizobiales bacterium]|nr:septation protein A [Hyphomicrobiales bacterium]
MKPGLKILIEMGPLLAFFAGNWWGGIFWGTGVFMVATAISLAVSRALTGKFAAVPLISAVFVGIFGALTLWLHSDLFIKVKMTLINALFGAILLGGLYFDKVYLKVVMGETIKMPREAWKTLTLRWGLFFLGLAVLNEIVWRSVSTDMWVNFKVFGVIPLTLLFAVANTPFLMKNMIEEKPKA